mgnify:CR=1 FL=1
MSLRIAAALIVALAAGPVLAQNSTDPGEVKSGRYTLDSDHSKVTWSVNHLGFSTYSGQISGVTGTMAYDKMSPAKTDLTVTIPLKGLATLNAELDKHLAAKDWFDAGRFPIATFKAARVEVTGDRTARVLGDLTLKGVTKPVVIEATFNASGVHPVDKMYTVGFDGRTTFKRSDFGISAFVPAVGDEVTLQIAAEFKGGK